MEQSRRTETLIAPIRERNDLIWRGAASRGRDVASNHAA